MRLNKLAPDIDRFIYATDFTSNQGLDGLCTIVEIRIGEIKRRIDHSHEYFIE